MVHKCLSKGDEGESHDRQQRLHVEMKSELQDYLDMKKKAMRVNIQ